MSRFLNNTIVDIRRGRESWRVFVMLCAPAFALGVAVTLKQLI